ncbi:hypothetical protein NDU88_001555 [Pleurodeles waltl]|uniref:Uncharacterized protein n=1 Tax=Pleurodeles waltl TaxID=8319 RepID=A0AAV7P721_PLEWA|nr:hypothetical protein NDU88_001555 [Pleurodeles waltl]
MSLCLVGEESREEGHWRERQPNHARRQRGQRGKNATEGREPAELQAMQLKSLCPDGDDGREVGAQKGRVSRASGPMAEATVPDNEDRAGEVHWWKRANVTLPGPAMADGERAVGGREPSEHQASQLKSPCLAGEDGAEGVVEGIGGAVGRRIQNVTVVTYVRQRGKTATEWRESAELQAMQLKSLCPDGDDGREVGAQKGRVSRASGPMAEATVPDNEDRAGEVHWWKRANVTLPGPAKADGERAVGGREPSEHQASQLKSPCLAGEDGAGGCCGGCWRGRLGEEYRIHCSNVRETGKFEAIDSQYM